MRATLRGVLNGNGPRDIDDNSAMVCCEWDFNCHPTHWTSGGEAQWHLFKALCWRQPPFTYLRLATGAPQNTSVHVAALEWVQPQRGACPVKMFKHINDQKQTNKETKTNSNLIGLFMKGIGFSLSLSPLQMSWLLVVP